MPYIREFFHEKFQLPIGFFNPLQNVTVSESRLSGMQSVAGSAHLLGELVGLALRSFTVCPVELNLRPAVVVRRHDLEKRWPFLFPRRGGFRFALAGWWPSSPRAAQV